MKSEKIKGVNLGGWLVLEHWITPSLFKGAKAQDEYSLCLELGDQKDKVIKQHRDNFVTKKDFKWIADNDLNAVRLPVGHWLFGGHEPYVESAEYVQRALDWAKEYKLKVLLDLHSAPGSQNGYDHSGRTGQMEWATNAKNITATIEIIRQLAKEFGRHQALWGIETLNEPHRDIPISIVQDYFRKAYKVIREHTADRVRVVFHDSYRPAAEWEDFLKEKAFTNVLLDMHLYQIHSEADKKLTFEEHLAKALKWKRRIDAFGPEKVLIGEWSAALSGTYDAMPAVSGRWARHLYSEAQKYAFAETAGWFYWNYKTEKNNDWNFYTAGLHL